MYCEYWNLQKDPFDNVPDPSMYADCHVSMENVISNTIFAIREANEAFAVIIGTAGSGKTLSLRIIIDSLEQDKYKIVIIANPGISFTDLLKEIIGQITGKPCEEESKTALLEIFNNLLFTTNDRGQKIVIFIDEANALSPANLENLRLLTNIQDDQRNLFTIVLAGQKDLAQRLEHPKRANLFQRIGSYSRIDKLPSEEAVQTYIQTRLKLAGAKSPIFSDDCIPIIWEYSEHGIPRLINKICKLCLKTAETYGFDYISANTARDISERFQNLSGAAIQKRKPRSRPDDIENPQSITENEPDDTVITETTADHETQNEIAEVQQILPDSASMEASPATEVSFTETPVTEVSPDAPLPVTSSATQPESEKELLSEPVPVDEELTDADKFSTIKSSNVHIAPNSLNGKTHHQADNGDDDEVVIGEHRIPLDIPKDILKQVKLFNRENANKSAGFWAAQIIKKNPQLTNSPQSDPVHIWNEIRDSILKKIAL